MYPSELRNLAAAYRGGFLDQAQYRRQRRQWLRDLQADRVALRHPPPSPSDQPTVPSYLAADDLVQQARSRLRPSGRWLLPTGIVVMALGLFAALQWHGDGAAPDLAAIPAPLESLSQRFLKERDWGADSVRDLTRRLRDHFAATRPPDGGNWLPRLHDAAARQLTQARAVAELGDAEAADCSVALDELLSLMRDQQAAPH